MSDVSQENFIEQLVRERNLEVSQSEIVKYLRKNKSDASIFLACDWYRRLGLFQKALTLVLRGDQFEGRYSTQTTDGLRLLWSARLLNQLGAGQYAYQILNHLNIDTVEAHQYAGAVCLSNFDFASGLQHYTRFIASHPEKAAYSFRVASLGYSDCLVELGEFEKAVDWVKGIHEQSIEPLLKGITLQVLGEYLAKKEDFALAAVYLEKAASYFPSSDTSVDYSLQTKWHGYVLIRTGHTEEGQTQLRKAVQLQKAMGLREEALFSTYLLLDRVDLLSSQDRNLVAYYPALSDHFRASLKIPMIEIRWGTGDQSNAIFIDRTRSEYLLNGIRHIGLPKEIQLLSWLRSTEDFGLSELKAMTVLWPNEVFSFSSLPQRLSQLVLRLRKIYGVEINVTKGRLTLSGDCFNRISVLDGPLKPPSFYENTTHFVRDDVTNYYSLSKTASVEIIKSWITKGFVCREGTGRSLRYRVNNNS